jgi:hypothetical protein
MVRNRCAWPSAGALRIYLGREASIAPGAVLRLRALWSQGGVCLRAPVFGFPSHMMDQIQRLTASFVDHDCTAPARSQMIRFAALSLLQPASSSITELLCLVLRDCPPLVLSAAGGWPCPLVVHCPWVCATHRTTGAHPKRVQSFLGQN